MAHNNRGYSSSGGGSWGNNNRNNNNQNRSRWGNTDNRDNNINHHGWGNTDNRDNNINHHGWGNTDNNSNYNGWGNSNSNRDRVNDHDRNNSNNRGWGNSNSDHDRDRSRSRDRRVDQQHHNNQHYGPGSQRSNSDAFRNYRDNDDDQSSFYSNQRHPTHSNHYNSYGGYNNNQRNNQQNQISSSSSSSSRSGNNSNQSHHNNNNYRNQDQSSSSSSRSQIQFVAEKKPYDKLYEDFEGKTLNEKVAAYMEAFEEMQTTSDNKKVLLFQGYPACRVISKDFGEKKGISCRLENIPAEFLELDKMLYSKDWMEKKMDAAKIAQARYKEEWLKKNNQNNDHSNTDEYFDDDEDSQDTFMAEARGGRDHDDINQQDKDIFTILPMLLLFDASFHSLELFEDNREFCWCPCSKYMRPVKLFFLGENKHDDSVFMTKEKNTCSNKFTPNALIQHIETKMHSGENNDVKEVHQIIYYYLEALYDNWQDSGLKHKALYNVSDKNYKRALEKENLKKYNTLRKTEIENANLKRENEAYVIKMKKLEETSENNYTKIKELEEMFKNLDIDDHRDSSFSELDRDNYYKAMKMYLTSIKREYTSVQNEKVLIRIPNKNFSLQEFFDGLYDENVPDVAFLLKDYEDNNHEILFKKWIITREDDTLTKSKDDKNLYVLQAMNDTYGTLDIDTVVIDQGGPTIQFFTDVWEQLETLKVCVLDDEGKPYQSELFEATDGGFIPRTDEYLELRLGKDLRPQLKKEFFKKVAAYYRAIGRLMFRALLSHCDEKGKTLLIPDKVLAKFYRNVLLRNCELQSPTAYDYRSILIDMSEIGLNTLKWKKDEDDKKTLLKFYEENWLNEDALTAEEKKQLCSRDLFFSKAVKNFIIDRRNISLSAMKDGLSLGGVHKISELLWVIQCKYLSSIIFASEEISLKKIIAKTNIDYGKENQKKRKFLNDEATCEFWANINEFAKEDNTFLRNFVQFITGQSYLSYGNEKSITIELTNGKQQVIAYTCNNQLVFCEQCGGNSKDDRKKFMRRTFSLAFAQMKEFTFTSE